MSQFTEDRDSYFIEQYANQVQTHLHHKKAAAEAERIRQYNAWHNRFRRYLAERLKNLAHVVQPDLEPRD